MSFDIFLTYTVHAEEVIAKKRPCFPIFPPNIRKLENSISQKYGKWECCILHMSDLMYCLVHLLGQNIFCPGQYLNCSEQKFCPGLKSPFFALKSH